MKDATPSLFDFEDEAFFPKPDGEEKAGVEKDTATDALADSDKEAEPVEKLEDKTAATSGTHPEEEKKINPLGWKPVLELPKTDAEYEVKDIVVVPDLVVFKNDVKEEETASDDNDFVEQNTNDPVVKPAFTFENRKEKSKNDVSDISENVKPEAIAENDLPSAPVSDLPEWDLDKKYYPIGEVAQLFEVNVSHIRFWTTEFKIKTRTTRKGDRLYTPKQIAELRLIHHLVKVKKHTLKGAKEALKSGSAQLEEKLDLKEALQKLYDVLKEIRVGL